MPIADSSDCNEAEVLGTDHPKMRFATGQASIDAVRVFLWLPRSGVGASLEAPASPSLAAGAAKVVFPRWNMGTSKDAIL